MNEIIEDFNFSLDWEMIDDRFSYFQTKNQGVLLLEQCSERFFKIYRTKDARFNPSYDFVTLMEFKGGLNHCVNWLRKCEVVIDKKIREMDY